ncbi:MAG: tetratricopeptide repeat protein [Verrucomicrobiota bacterium]
MRPGFIVILLILVAVPYVTALQHAFVYDDHGSIVENPFLRDPANLRAAVTLATVADPSVPDGRRPMVILSYFLDRVVWGLAPFGYHLTNVFLHLFAVVLVFILVRRLAPDEPFFQAASALLFGLHPVLTEVVQVPAFREDLLVTVFVLLYLLACTASARPAWWRMAVGMLALVAALVSKESAAVAPLLLLWLWICFPAVRPARRTATLLLGAQVAVVAWFASAWILGGSLQAASTEAPAFGLRFPVNLLTAPLLWLKTLRMLVWPHPLLTDYVIDPVTSPLDPPFLAGVGALLGCAALALAYVRRQPWLSLGLGWMMAAFLPVSNLVPLYNPFAERYLYFMAIGFALLLARALTTRPRRPARPVLLAAVATVYGALAIARLADWADDYTLWSRTLEQEPRSSRAHTWVGLELKHRGAVMEALRHLMTADQLNPQDVTALINIAVIYGEHGRLAEAESALREAIRRRPDKADAHWNLAVALQQQGKEEEATTELARTLELDPRHEPASSLPPWSGPPPVTPD